MDFFLAMSIFSSAPDLSRDKGKSREWIRAWESPRSNHQGAGAGAGAAAAEGRPQQQGMPQELGTRPHRGPRLAPEFDGINCFETMVSHR